MADAETLRGRIRALQDGRNRLAADFGAGKFKVKDKEMVLKHGDNITKDIIRLKEQLRQAHKKKKKIKKKTRKRVRYAMARDDV